MSQFVRKATPSDRSYPREAVRGTARLHPNHQRSGRFGKSEGQGQVAIQRRFVTKFRAIGTPPGDRSAADLVSRMARGIPLAVKIQRSFASRDTTRLPAVLSDYLDFTLSLNRRVAAYGFRVCGR